MHAFMTLQRKIDEQTFAGPGRPRHLDPEAPSEFPVPTLGEDDIVPAKNPDLYRAPVVVRG
jgi:NADH-quinone oxidoreductase subunit B